MAYEKTEWKSGDTITAEKLNNIEEGIESVSGGLFIITFDNVTRVSDKTFGEIRQVYMGGQPVMAVLPDDEGCGFELLSGLNYFMNDNPESGDVYAEGHLYFSNFSVGVAATEDESKTLATLDAKYPFID